MKSIRNTQFVIIILTFAISTFGQTANRETPLPSTAPGGPGWVVYENRSTKKPDNIPSILPSAEDRRKYEKLRKDLEKDRAEFLKELHDKLRVADEYFIKYSSYIDSKKANLVRIFPEIYCDNGKTVSVEDLERCSDRPQIPGAGSLYSFRLFEMPNYLYVDVIKSFISQSDIHFVDNKLIVGTKLTQDIIADIGDTPIETINDKSIAYTFLHKWKRVDKKSQLDEQNKLLAQGIENNGYTFSNNVTVKKDTTYILRSIAYFEKYNSFWNTDQIVVFRVVGQEPDGSIIILWKHLKKMSCTNICQELILSQG